MPRQQQLQQHWSRNGGMPRQQQPQRNWSRGGGLPRQQQQQHQWSRGSSHVFPPARQARQEEPLQQPSRGIPTIGGDEEEENGPLSETVFGGDDGAVEERLQSDNMEMPLFSLSEGPQQSAPTAVALAAAAPAAEAVTGTSVFPTASVGMMAGAPAAAGTRVAALTAAPSTGDTAAPDASVERAARQLTSEESSAGTASSDTAAEAAPLTGDTTSPDASVERVARKLALEAGSSSEICSERGTSTHPFDPGTMFPLEVRYYNSSWPKHGSNSNSSSSSNSSGNGSSSSSNDTTSNHDSRWEATCVGALLRPFDPGKRCRRSARRVKAVLGLDLPFDRWRAWRRMQHGGGCSMEGEGLRAEGEFLVLFGLNRERLESRVLETDMVFLCSTRENHEGGEYDVMILATVQTYFLLFRGGM